MNFDFIQGATAKELEQSSPFATNSLAEPILYEQCIDRAKEG